MSNTSANKPRTSAYHSDAPKVHGLVSPTALPKYAQNAPAGQLPDNLYDVVIIGAGVAGLTAAIYATRANKRVLVVEKLTYGGQIVNAPWIENYPAIAHISGTDFATSLFSQAEELGVEFQFEEATSIQDFDIFKAIIATQNIYYGRTVILATGSVERRMGLPNEASLVGRGVSYCAICDGAFYRDKDVAVLGGGNVSISDALYLTNIARTVHVIHRRGEFRADPFLLNRLEEKTNVFFKIRTQLTELITDNAGLLSAIKLEDRQKTTSILPVSCVFVAIGRVPANQLVKDLLAFDRSGYVKADESCTTSVPGLFVAGDNRTKVVRQLVTAAADGAAAATAAVNLLNGKDNRRDVYTW